jgi:AcrR family transcriptional regulator
MNNRVGKGLGTRQRIVITATRLFAEAGYEQTSIEVVLEQTALSRGALYHHFDSKEKIFEAVLETVEADIAKAIISASRGIIDPVAALQAGCDAFLRMARDKTVRQIVLIDAPSVLGWQKWREIDERHGFGLLKASLKAAAAKGRGQADLTDMYAHMLLAALSETALVIARATQPAIATRNGRAAIRELIKGLLGD